MLAAALAGADARAQSRLDDLDKPPHLYRQQALHDRFTRLRKEIDAGTATLDRTSEKAFLESFLKLLDVPVSSQLLVFSTTSLQLRLISPSNPRAIYFNDEIYVGYIPGGRIEVVSLDPDLGGIFHIFSIPKNSEPLTVERSERCMNCHSGDDTRQVPGLVLKSVVPGPGGGSLTAYRLSDTGHMIPLSERFGGWHVTGIPGFTNHWGNLTGTLSEGKLTPIPNPFGARFDIQRYPAATSDILPHLLLEHQTGFVNRAVEATYRAREILHEDGGRPTAAHGTELDTLAREFARYILFEDEAPLPSGGIAGDPAFRRDFLAGRRAVGNESLKDFDLTGRLFRHRCSYMVYSPVFAGMPVEIKSRVYREIGSRLSLPRFGGQERESIRRILRGTLPDLPAGW